MANEKQWSIQELMGTLNKDQTLMLSYMMHICTQKGRIIGRMEKDGKNAKDMNDVLHVGEENIQAILDEDPYEVIAK